ncbi:MAG TPA: zinc ABC transporter substrate-binding protein [Thermomicrobiales bacterium]|nr:zinc ABC transporter substrate-binding protein [Thermomicrobiales bacterium]
MMTRRRLIAGGVLTVGAIATGVAFASESSLRDDGRSRVTATVGMIADVARNIGGERIDAIGLMGPGVDPHLYKPSAGDITRLGDADLILYGGLHLEGRMSETFDKIDELGDKPAVAVSETIPVERRLRFGPEMWDPHVWFDVSLWRLVGDRILQALVETFPAYADDFAANAEVYLGKLDELDAWVLEATHRIPEEQRVLVTAHDAFNYFGRRYGFEVRGLQGMSTATEAGAGDVQDLAAFITERQIRAMFIESSVPPSTIEAVQAACRAKGWDVAIGGELYSDAMGESGTPEGTYIGMVRANVHTIVDALLGEG